MITAIAMVAAILVASYAIDTSIWYVHTRHLQTQADAAALAASEDYQFNCGSAGDTTIKNDVHLYDGTALGLSSGTHPYNPQVPLQYPSTPTSPTPSSTSGSGQLEYSLVNASNYKNQTYPADTGLTGSPCTDGLIDVKVTEQGIPSYLIPGISPTYLNAQAQVAFQTENSTSGAEPFIEPLPSPSSVAVEFVDEANGDVLSTPGVISLSTASGPTSGMDWTASGVNLNFADPTTGSTTDEFPVGMRVAVNPSGGGASFPCTGAETCYDNSGVSNLGVTYTRVWSNAGTPGSPAINPVAPQASDVWLQPCTVSGSSCTSTCPSTPSPSVSNFFNSSSNVSEQLCANMNFGGTLTNAQVSLTTKAGGSTIAMTAPTGGPNGTWASGPITVSPITGEMGITTSWSTTAGCLPVGASGGATDGTGTCTQGATHKKCTAASACTGSFDGNPATTPETVQQAYSGADNLMDGQSTANGGLGEGFSGTISSAAVTNSSGNEIQSTQNGTNVTNANISVDFYGWLSESSVGGAPFELALGGNQANGDLGCNGNGVPQFEQAIETGCPGTYGTTSVYPSSAACSGSPTPPVCVNENPGGGKSSRIGQALNVKINGGGSTCTDPNFWTSPNSVGGILARQVAGVSDPRLVTLFYTDNGELINGSATVPIRGFAEFYITGWGGTGTNQDPCLSSANGGVGTSGTDPASGLSYTTDDAVPGNSSSSDGIVMGHFVTYVNPTGTGSGTNCTSGTLAVCVPVLTK